MPDKRTNASPQLEAASARFDELTDATGKVRSHWQPLTAALKAIAPEEYARRRESAHAMVRDNGVTYNVYDEASGGARPWQLDILPFVIGSADWRAIEAGIIQRAELANAVLRDIYGPQQLIKDGHLPPHIVFGHPQFLRPLVGLPPPQGVYIHLYTADLARQPDGSWMVLSSRADAPSGLGYALENRIVVGQTFPELFGEMRIQRLASFFNAHREAIFSLAHAREGRAVLLTPGPHNEAYFEHAYLAHYLGLTLVEGDDLAARDGVIFLKTLSGLERVAVIFRRIDSDYCDPLELRGDSALGIPGLVDALRAGSVVLANALGSGVLESPALDAYLPGLAHALLDEDLKIPDIPTVWCGTEWGRREAMARLDRVIVRGAFDARPLFSRASSARLGSDLDANERRRLREHLSRRGATVVTQDVVPLGLAPVFKQGAFDAQPVSLRVFAAWTPLGYIVMPGGLTRVAAHEESHALSMQSGAESKDTWVAAQGAVDSFSLLRQTGEGVAIRRLGEAPPSRAMDNLFWLGRYAERAENLVRMVRAVVQRLSEEAGAAPDIAQSLLKAFAPAMAHAGGVETSLAPRLQNLLYNRRSPDGLQSLLARVQHTAWSARDRLSLDTWRTIRTFTQADGLPDADQSFDPAETVSYLDALIRRAAALSGLSAENMTRGPNWLFLELGRRIERVIHLAGIVRLTASTADALEIDRLRIALEIADSAMTYRSRYLNVFDAAPLIDLLLLDETNPRSVAFQLAAIEANLRELPRVTPGQRSNAAMKLITGALAATRHDGVALAQTSETGTRRHLIAFTGEIETAMFLLNDMITEAYFQHAVRRRTGPSKGAV